MRPQNRRPDEARSLSFTHRFTGRAPGSVLVRAGRTAVLCTCCVEETVPPFLVGSGRGWLTAEYGMLPGSTHGRKPRDKAGKVDGRTVEIQRLIGRSLRAIVDLSKLGERTLWLDCDVLEADGGTRTAAVTGAFVALVDALWSLHAEPPREGVPPVPCLADILTDSVAAVSVGVVSGEARLDLEYVEDKDAEVDMNLVMTGRGQYVEVQGTAEKATFDDARLSQLLALGRTGIARITESQRVSLGERWPWR